MSPKHVVSVEFIKMSEPVTVYDLSIKQDKSFLLANGIIAHNSTICIARHGLKYTADELHTPIGHDIPYLNGVPYHPNCRSSILTVLRDGGPVRDETLTAWLQRKGTAFQDEVLGPTRAQMFRDGRLGSPRNLIDALSGRPLRLDEL